MLTFDINTCKIAFIWIFYRKKSWIHSERCSTFPDVLIFPMGLYKTNFSRWQSDYSDINKSKRELLSSIDPEAMFFRMKYLFREILALRVKVPEISQEENKFICNKISKKNHALRRIWNSFQNYQNIVAELYFLIRWKDVLK